ncbi:hypothetical protein B0H12DRAFT_288128 [Mycena haematopus]|nr:hypothetical protein B0H12DRAFT_288128 [Mycena haematopus]
MPQAAMGVGASSAGAGAGSENAKAKSRGKSTAKKRKGAQTSAMWGLGSRPRLGVDMLEDLEIDDSALRDGEYMEGDDDGDEDEDEAEAEDREEDEGGEQEDDWAFLDHTEAELADMTPTPTLSRAAFGHKQRGGLRGVFDVGADGDEDEEAFPAALSAMHRVSSPTEAGEGIGVVREIEGDEEGGQEEGDAQEDRGGEEGAAAGAEHLAALSAQLDAFSIQLGTLHGRLRALQAASPVSFADGENAIVEGARLDGLDARVRALEGAVASSTSTSTSTIASTIPSSLPLPTPDPSPSIPSFAPAALASSASTSPSLYPSSPSAGAATNEGGVVQAEGEDVEGIQAALQAGLAALQAEWAAFRAEAAAFPPAFPPASLSSVLGASSSTTATGGAGAFDGPEPRGAADLARGGSSAIASGNERGLWLRRREVYGADADVDGEEERASDTSSSSLSDDQDIAAVASHLRVARHAEDDDDARVPGRWGLLTPEGSVRGGLADSSASAAPNVTIPLTAKATLFHSTTPTAGTPTNGVLGFGEGSVGNHEEGAAPLRPLANPTKWEKASRSQTDVPQPLLLFGAVGAGMMIVAAAWWGA